MAAYQGPVRARDEGAQDWRSRLARVARSGNLTEGAKRKPRFKRQGKRG